jgi:hypothetical protein
MALAEGSFGSMRNPPFPSVVATPTRRVAGLGAWRSRPWAIVMVVWQVAMAQVGRNTVWTMSGHAAAPPSVKRPGSSRVPGQPTTAAAASAAKEKRERMAAPGITALRVPHRR